MSLQKCTYGQGQASRFPNGWLKLSGSPGYPRYTPAIIGWTGNHRSFIPGLMRSTLGVPMLSGLRP